MGKKYFLVQGLLNTVIILILIYFGTRVFFFLVNPYPWYEKVLASFLLIAEIFLLMNVLGYVLEILRLVINKLLFPVKKQAYVPSSATPLVAILIPSYKEPLEMLDSTLGICYNLSYQNKLIFLLDDTKYEENPRDLTLQKYKKDIEDLCKKWGVNLFRRKWRGAKAGIINDLLFYFQNKPLEGSHLNEYAKQKLSKTPEYLVIFDADQNPMQNCVETLLTTMEKDPLLALVQTPQYYTNIEENRVSNAAGLQQVIFYEYICEGKGAADAMFCCGTNVMLRTKALIDVEGFDESTVTEDFATSLKFHLKGWKTAYDPTVTAFGMGPEDLPSYFKQQYRWAFGSFSVFKKVLKSFFTSPYKLSFVKWWEYFLSCTFYFIGWAYFILFTFPLLYIFFSLPSYFANYRIYAISFVPYFLVALISFYWLLGKRDYKAKDILLGQCILSITFPIYMRAIANCLMGKKMKFEITSKTQEKKIPLKVIYLQIFYMTILFIGIIWGLNRMYYEHEPLIALGINIFWCIYNFSLLCTTFYFFNTGEET